MKRWTAPKYKPHVSRKAEQVAKDYLELAKHYERLARDDKKFNEQRKREGRPIVKAVKLSMYRHLRRAKTLRSKARRYQGVFSRD